MSTSNRTLLAESLAASAVVLGLTFVVSPGDLSMPGSGLHPGWIAVVVISARYGVRGLYLSLGAVWGPLLAASALVPGSAEGFSNRLHGFSDLMALSSAVAVAWVAMSHERRILRATAKLESADEARRELEGTAATMQRSLTQLRARCDRMDMSISLWRSIARCLERGDSHEAARAALELCSLRSGSIAGVVLRSVCGGTSEADDSPILAQRGMWAPGSLSNTAASSDRTALAAIESGVPRTATDVIDAGELDSDLAIPALDDLDGSVLGVIALRGVDPGRLNAAVMRDLSLIAAWLAPSLPRPVGPRLRAVPHRPGEPAAAAGEVDAALADQPGAPESVDRRGAGYRNVTLSPLRSPRAGEVGGAPEWSRVTGGEAGSGK